MMQTTSIELWTSEKKNVSSENVSSEKESSAKESSKKESSEKVSTENESPENKPPRTAESGDEQPPSGRITELLEEWSQGDEEAFASLVPLVYDHLRAIAANQLRRERPGHTLQTTALVHETYLRLIRQERVKWQNRSHFYGIAAQMIRRVLVDHARHHLYAKRGGGQVHVPLEDLGELPALRDEQVVAVDEALAHLQAMDPSLAQLVELRFFGGLSIEELSSVLDISERTISRRWRTAKAWLYSFLNREDGAAP